MRLSSANRAGPILAALGAGLAAGAVAGRAPGAWLVDAQAVASTIGGLWVDALKMTIVPLIAALVVTSVGNRPGAEGGRLSARALGLFALMLGGSALVGLAIVPPLFAGHHVASAAAVTAIEVPPIPAAGEWLRALVPTNIVEAAASDKIIAVVLFGLLLGAAAARIDPAKRAVLMRFFVGLREAMLLLVGWILLFSPLGVAALAFVAASGDLAGVAGVGLLYVLSQILVSFGVMAAAVLLVAVARRQLLKRFLGAALRPLLLAAGSRSSIACLPSMVEASEEIGLEQAGSATVLSLAVSLFKLSNPGTIIGTMAALAAFGGAQLTLAQAMIIAAMGVVSTLGVAGLPGAVSFFAVMIPTAQAAGIPVTYLPLLLAVEAFGDMARTMCNVLGDLMAAALLVPVRQGGDAG